jgi:para-aminobenzoate synthetase component I
VDRARFADRRAREVVDVRHGPDALEAMTRGGFWAVVATFEGDITAIRFGVVETGGATGAADAASPTWTPVEGAWTSSLDRAAYVSAVQEVRERIAAGYVYQVNVCRVLSHGLAEEADLGGLDLLLQQGNPAPYGARVRCDEAGIDLVCASPELFLGRRGGRLVTRPIKGTAPTAERMLPKDHAENVMIVDLMRNDISGVCEPGTVSVDELCVTEAHPGLVHLVSTVSGRLRGDVDWPEIFGATFPPGSVSGAPKSSALTTIGDLEPAPRGPYCGAVGWVDSDDRSAELAVGIRTFWADHDPDRARRLHFGTGAGITWHSDPEGEWRETELKAARLIGLAAGTVTP